MWWSTLVSLILFSGDTITFVDYYKRQYNTTIQDLKQVQLLERLLIICFRGLQISARIPWF